MKVINELLLQMVPVVLGILVALFINNWKDDLDDRKFLEVTLSAIEKEMRSNAKDIAEVMVRHEVLMDTLSYYAEEEDVTIIDIARKVNGIQTPTVRNVAWKAFLNTKIQLIDFETIALLTDIEDSKTLLGQKIERIGDVAYKDVVSSTKETKIMLAIIISDVLDSEKRLLELTNAFLERKK